MIITLVLRLVPRLIILISFNTLSYSSYIIYRILEIGFYELSL